MSCSPDIQSCCHTSLSQHCSVCLGPNLPICHFYGKMPLSISLPISFIELFSNLNMQVNYLGILLICTFSSSGTVLQGLHFYQSPRWCGCCFMDILGTKTPSHKGISPELWQCTVHWTLSYTSFAIVQSQFYLYQSTEAPEVRNYESFRCKWQESN